MIECKDILALCDRFEAFLMPLDIHVLRLRYNGKTFNSTYAVARDMGISDETVRTIEYRALAAIDHCLDLEAHGQAITPMRLAKSFRQPVASEICASRHPVVTAAAYTGPPRRADHLRLQPPSRARQRISPQRRHRQPRPAHRLLLRPHTPYQSPSMAPRLRAARDLPRAHSVPSHPGTKQTPGPAHRGHTEETPTWTAHHSARPTSRAAWQPGLLRIIYPFAR
jgi:hypothetical protein